jgi:large subunit ribosomal protein L9
MEVILKQDVKSLGHKDEIVKVRDGFGRNYLIPQGFAIVANDGNKKMLTETLRQRAHKEAKIRQEAEANVQKLASLELTIGAKVGESGKIFGSVNAIQLAEALKKAGYDLDRKNITVDAESIKALGKYTAHVKLYKDITVEVNFEVVAE